MARLHTSCMATRLSSRMTYVALAAGTMALGLWVHRWGTALGPVAQDVVGDALWGAMMACCIQGAGCQVRLCCQRERMGHRSRRRVATWRAGRLAEPLAAAGWR